MSTTNSHILKINHRKGQFVVDVTGDPYGEAFWKSIESRKYEPDTLGFLEDNLSSNHVFLDIGAANGAMSVIASLLGCKVFSYEPDPTMFDILKRNIELNPKIAKHITLKNVGISNESGTIEFSATADSTILSSIVVGDKVASGKMVSIHALSNEINTIPNISNSKLIIKMDIEGAEWRILNDEDVLNCLKENHATILLAVHPGFYRPHTKLVRGIDRLLITIWHLRNYLESLRTYKKIKKYGNITRTNLNPVRNAHNFAILVLGGYHEYILNF